MLNALLDFGGNDGIGVSLGGGVGISNASLNKLYRQHAKGPTFLTMTVMRALLGRQSPSCACR